MAANFVNGGKRGVQQGLSVDVLARFAEETGIRLEYVEAENYMEAIRMTEAGETDITAMVVRYPDSENFYKIVLSEPYLETEIMMLHSKKADIMQSTDYTVAEVNGYPTLELEPGVVHMDFDKPSECLLAIRTGQADTMYCNNYTGTDFIQRYENRELIALPLDIEVQFRFGVSEKDGDILTGLLNRTIVSLDKEIINKSLGVNRIDSKYTIGDFVYFHPFEIISVMLGVTFLGILILVIYTRTKGQQTVSLQGYTKSYSMLADTVGGAGLNYDCIRDTMTVFGKYADTIAMPAEIRNFSAYLGREDREISLTKEQLEQMIEDGMTGNAYDRELECKVVGGEWQHYRLVYSVLSTDAAYRKPLRVVGYLTNAEEAYKEKENLMHLGMYDKLTTLYNRSGAEKAIRKHAKEEGGTNKDVLLMMDIDYFKNINDTKGHVCGDDVLMNVGHCLKRIFRKDDILCRWGGDEFFLYLTGAANHIDLIEKRCAALQWTMKGYHYEGEAIPITFSIGGAVVGAHSVKETMKLADKALYHVKEQGRDGIYIISAKEAAKMYDGEEGV